MVNVIIIRVLIPFDGSTIGTKILAVSQAMKDVIVRNFIIGIVENNSYCTVVIIPARGIIDDVEIMNRILGNEVILPMDGDAFSNIGNLIIANNIVV